MGDVSSPACVRFSPQTRPLIAAPRHEPARHGIQRRRLNALPDRPRAPRAPRPRGSPRPPRRDHRPPRVLGGCGRYGVRGGSSRRGRQGVHPRRGRVRRAPRRGPRVRRAQRARCASTIPLGPISMPHATHTRTVGAHLNRITKHLVPSAHPSPSPFPPRFPQTQRPREAASSTAAAPSSSAATTSPARTSSRNTARTFASPTSRAPRCARRNSGALTSRARTS